MDPIRTLLLARTHTVVLDPDRVAMAATRPARDTDVDNFEDELLQLGYVMSLDLAMTIRRFPHQAISELRTWIVDTLAKGLGAHRPHVPLFRGFPAATPGDTLALYQHRVLTWLHTRADQPCPWCGETKTVGSLDPCGHLVCRSCWDGGSYAGCPICHRRVALNEPFVQWPKDARATADRVGHHSGELRLIHLALDVVGVARARFERIATRATPLSKEDREELEIVIDAMGPKAAAWLPKHIAVRETMAIAVARLWLVSPDRAAMVKATADHVKTATDVLRIAAVLMGGSAAFDDHARQRSLAFSTSGPSGPMKLASISRGLRRAVLEALDRLPSELVVEDMRRHAGLWKRVGERLHPFEHVKRLPAAALAFAAVRGTDLSPPGFAELRARAQAITTLKLDGDRIAITPWAGPAEHALRTGDARAAIARLSGRPGELLRRVDHVARVTIAQQPDALGEVLDAIRAAVPSGSPAMLLGLAAHVARRGEPWPRRVFFPKGEVLHAWTTADTRAPLRADVIGGVVNAVRGELVARAATRRNFARAVLDRGLRDLLVPIGERSASKTQLAWPRGSRIAIPDGATVRLFLHWEEPPNACVDLDLSVALFDADWRHVGTCDFRNLVVGERAAIHSGDLTSGPAPLGASEFVDLELPALVATRARHAVMIVFSYNAISFDRLVHGFAGLMVAPTGDAAFDPRSVTQRFDLHGRSVITIPLTIDLAARRLIWLDVHITGHRQLHEVGGYVPALAHLGKDFADFTGTDARATLWDVATIHAAARANTIYVRDAAGVTMFRRRDNENPTARLGRLLAGEHDGVSKIPPTNAPTWFALLREDLAFPRGSEGYLLDPRGSAADGVTRLSAADLVGQL